MPRTLPPREGDASPWGSIDNVTPLGPDAVAVTTPSHGGIWVSPAGLAKIPEPLRATAYSGGGWFEEDCDWCIPYLALGLHAFEEPAERQDRCSSRGPADPPDLARSRTRPARPRPASAADHEGATHD